MEMSDSVYSGAVDFSSNLRGRLKTSLSMSLPAELDRVGIMAADVVRDQGVQVSPRRKARGTAHRARNITLDELSENFHLPINEVAVKLGLCVTVLKQRCREHGIKRWPYRKVRKLDALIDTLEREDSLGVEEPIVCQVTDERRRKLESAKETRNFLLMNPNSAAHLKLGKVKSNSLRRTSSFPPKPCLMRGGSKLSAFGSPSACRSDCTTDNLTSGEVCDDLSSESTEDGASAEARSPVFVEEHMSDKIDLTMGSSPQPITVQDLLGTLGNNSNKPSEKHPANEAPANHLGIDIRHASIGPSQAAPLTRHHFPPYHEFPRLFEPLLPSTGPLAHSERSAFRPPLRQNSIASSSSDCQPQSPLKPQPHNFQAPFHASQEPQGSPTLTRPVARAGPLGDLSSVPTLGLGPKVDNYSFVGAGLVPSWLDPQPSSPRASAVGSPSSASSMSYSHPQLFGQPMHCTRRSSQCWPPIISPAGPQLQPGLTLAAGSRQQAQP